MASKSLGTLTLDLVARIGGFEKGMDSAARISEKRLKQIEATAKKIGVGIGVAFTGAAAGILAFVNSQSKAIAGYQDIAEKIGDTAEAVASLKAASDVSETSLDDVATASIKLTAALSKTDDEAKGVGKALGAIGISIEDFKKLSPVDQIDQIARALAGFEDGASKTAVAVALFGKSGAQLLPFLNDLADGAERQVTVTQDQIDAANELQETLAGLRGEFGTVQQKLAGEIIPVVLDVVRAFSDFIREVKIAAGDTSIKTFAQNTVLAFTTVGEAIFGVIKLLNAVRGSFQSFYADIKLIERLSPLGAAKSLLDGSTLKGALDERNRVAEEANRRYIDLWTYNGTQVSDSLRKSFEAQKDYAGKARALVDQVTGFLPKPPDAGGLIPFRPGMEPKAKPQINYAPDPEKTRKDTEKAKKAIDEYSTSLESARAIQEEVNRMQDANNNLLRDAATVYEATRTPLEKFNAELTHLNSLRDTFVDGKPLIDAETYKRAVQSAQDDLYGLGETTKEVTDEMSVYTEQAARNMQDAFADFLFDPFKDGLSGLLKSFADTLQRMAAEAAAAQIFNSFGFGQGQQSAGAPQVGGSGSIGGFADYFKAIFGGFFVNGGSVMPGKAYVVGEKGPEVFVPGGAGYIIPNHAMRDGANITINVPIHTATGSVDPRTRYQVAQDVARETQRVMGRS